MHFSLAAAWIPPEAGQLLFFALLGLIAGGVRASQRSASNMLPLRDVITQAAGGATAAFVAGAICKQFWGPDRLYLSMAVATVAGWSGTILIDKAAAAMGQAADRRLQQQLGNPPPPTPPAANPGIKDAKP